MLGSFFPLYIPIYPKQPGALLSLLTLLEGKEGEPLFFFRPTDFTLMNGQGYFSSCKQILSKGWV